MKSKNGLLFRCDIKQAIREGQTYALRHGVAKFKPKSSVRRDKFKTFFSVYNLVHRDWLGKLCTHKRNSQISIFNVFWKIKKRSTNRELRLRKQRFLIEKFCTFVFFILNNNRHIKKFNQNKMLQLQQDKYEDSFYFTYGPLFFVIDRFSRVDNTFTCFRALSELLHPSPHLESILGKLTSVRYI